MKPYYQDASVKIYHADCREVLSAMKPGSVDLVLTDPPYGLGIDGAHESIRHGVQIRKAYEFRGWDAERPSRKVLEAAFGVGKDLVVFGANYFNDLLPPGKKGWVVWDKGQRDLTMSDCEIIFTSLNRPTRIRTLHRSRLWSAKPQHPTQKPIEIVGWCLAQFPDAQTILDPFMGSGTTLRAAKDAGRHAVGIEIDEHYCEVAAKRMEQSTLGVL